MLREVTIGPTRQEGCRICAQMGLAYNNYILFSLTSVNAGKRREVVSFGLWGSVFVVKDLGILQTPQIFGQISPVADLPGLTCG